MGPFDRVASRRRFLVGMGGGAAALALAPSAAIAAPRAERPAPSAGQPPLAAAAGPGDSAHRVWVWQFNQDGSPEAIRQRLAARGLAVALKTHDGVNWMSRYDTDPAAVSGPEQIAAVNGLAGIHLIRVGQMLRIP